MTFSAPKKSAEAQRENTPHQAAATVRIRSLSSGSSARICAASACACAIRCDQNEKSDHFVGINRSGIAIKNSDT